MLKILGAKLELTGGDEGMEGAIQRACQLVESDPDHCVMLQQFENPANPAIHFKTTGPEIWDDTDGAIDVLVSGVGTGGTISGISWYIKQKMGKQIVSVAVEPSKSPVISQKLAGEPLRPGHHHLIQGIGAGFIPKTLDLSVVDRVEQVSDEEAIEYAPPPRPKRGTAVRDLLRRRNGGRLPPCQGTGIRGQDDRRDPARQRRTLSQ